MIGRRGVGAWMALAGIGAVGACGGDAEIEQPAPLYGQAPIAYPLELWDQDGDYSRTGLEEEVQDVLGVPIPRVTVPLNPGKNVTVIAEVVAMNHLLKFSGINSAAVFDRKLRQYLEQDFE